MVDIPREALPLSGLIPELIPEASGFTPDSR